MTRKSKIENRKGKDTFVKQRQEMRNWGKHKKEREKITTVKMETGISKKEETKESERYRLK